MSRPDRPAVLLILDGWNRGEPSEDNASHMARTPNIDALFEKYPHTMIEASGLDVGLPQGQMGNSEVGHLNLGAGRIVDQDITRIDKAAASGELLRCEAVSDLIGAARGGTLHLLGLVSDGGVHSSLVHLEALVRGACAAGIRVRLHALLDGRDTPPRSGAGYLSRMVDLAREIEQDGGDFAIGTVGGRYWGMDRDQRWERVEKHWRCLMGIDPPTATDPVAAVEASYAEDIGDEFVEPVMIVDGDGKPLAGIEDGDAVFLFNFRADRARQISRALGEEDFTEFPRSRFPRISFATMTEYDDSFGYPTAFPPCKLEGIFADVLTREGLSNLRVAETEKYAHVTFFFNGGVEQPWPGEERILIPSPKVATYDLQPEMSVHLVTDALLENLAPPKYDLYVVNFANCDMVGHTGVMSAAIEAMEAVDHCVGRVVEAVLEVGGVMIITADHGNIEKMWDHTTGEPHTAHTTGPVPLVLIDSRHGGGLRPGRLADVIPTILDCLGLIMSPEMTGESLKSSE